MEIINRKDLKEKAEEIKISHEDIEALNNEIIKGYRQDKDYVQVNCTLDSVFTPSFFIPTLRTTRKDLIRELKEAGYDAIKEKDHKDTVTIFLNKDK